MLGYISSTRRKSCAACIKAKRRCDLGYPCCKRCFAKGLACHYKGVQTSSTISQAEVVVRASSPDLACQDPSFSYPQYSARTTPPSSSDEDTSSIGQMSSAGAGAPESRSPADELDHELQQFQYPHPQLTDSLLPTMWEPCVLNSGQISYLINQLFSFVRSLAYAGSTPFMHETLYETWQPVAYQDACALSALYLMKTNKNSHTIIRSIDTKIRSLISSSTTWSLTEHLASVQVLLIYQIILLFDSTLDQKSLATKRMALLEKWSTSLWRRSLTESHTFASAHQSWAYYESVRRTVLTCLMLRGTLNSFTNNGVCGMTHILTRMPVTDDGKLWDMDAAEWAVQDADGYSRDAIISYGDYGLDWELGKAHKVGEFEKWLLVACKGEWILKEIEERVSEV